MVITAYMCSGREWRGRGRRDREREGGKERERRRERGRERAIILCFVLCPNW